MLIENYPDYKSAVRVATRPEKKYIFERHELEAGESIPWHFHRKAEEIIIADEGDFLLAAGKEREVLNIKKGDGAKAIYLSQGEAHALLAISKVSYSVYKTQEDKIVHCKGPDLKKELKKILSGLIKKYAKNS